jgi:hypothetical protein
VRYERQAYHGTEDDEGPSQAEAEVREVLQKQGERGQARQPGPVGIHQHPENGGGASQEVRGGLKKVADEILEHEFGIKRTWRWQRKAALLVAEFTVFYEHFDLGAGDTVEIENPLFGGRRFYIETISRLDRFRALVRAVEWW